MKGRTAVAAMFMGLTIANIGGVPAATWVGHALGWRESFGAIAALGLIAIASLWLALPGGRAGTAPNVRSELRVLTRPAVLMALATTIVSAGAITALLALVGVGFTIGNAIGGKMADRSINATLAAPS